MALCVVSGGGRGNYDFMCHQRVVRSCALCIRGKNELFTPGSSKPSRRLVHRPYVLGTSFYETKKRAHLLSDASSVWSPRRRCIDYRSLQQSWSTIDLTSRTLKVGVPPVFYLLLCCHQYKTVFGKSKHRTRIKCILYFIDSLSYVKGVLLDCTNTPESLKPSLRLILIHGSHDFGK